MSTENTTPDAKKNTAILLAAKDGAEYIGELLESLAAQTYRDFTVYLHDDGSTDETLKIFVGYAEREPERFRVIDAPPQGGARENFFFLMREVEADYYLFADDDDVWHPDKVEKLIAAIRKDAPAAAFCDMRVVDARLNEIAPSFIEYMGRSGGLTAYTEILIDNPAAGCALAMNRVLRDIAVQCADIGRVEMHDAWVMMCAAVFGSISFVPEALVDYRQHGDNELGAVTESTLQKAMRNLSDFFSGRMRENKREFFAISRGLAGEILRLPDVPEEKRRVLEGYLDFPNHGRLYRMRYCRQNNIHRAHHSFWMSLWV